MTTINVTRNPDIDYDVEPMTYENAPEWLTAYEYFERTHRSGVELTRYEGCEITERDLAEHCKKQGYCVARFEDADGNTLNFQREWLFFYMYDALNDILGEKIKALTRELGEAA